MLAVLIITTTIRTSINTSIVFLNCIMKMNSFHINSSHKSFTDRQKTLFEELDKVYKHVPQNDITTGEASTDNKNNRTEVRQFKGKESIFKRPEAPISKCLPLRKLPDFVVNPHKWKRYSLEDVNEEDISERGNRAAALSFLKELEDRNSKNRPTSVASTGKIMFNKTAMVKEGDDLPETKHSFKNSKILMPEYVVGQKIKKEKKNKEKRTGHVTKQLTLNHLLEEDVNQEDS